MKRRFALTVCAALMLAPLGGFWAPPAAAQSLDFSSGFTSAAGLTLNGNATVAGSNIRLTDGGLGEAGSGFSTAPVYVTKFTNEFTFQLHDGTVPPADGISFTVQGVGPTALGGGGGGLGCFTLPHSVAVKFDIYNNSGEGTDSTGLYPNGAFPSVPATDLSGAGISLYNHPCRVTMSYNGSALTVTITDLVTHHSATQTYAVDIPTIVGGQVAFVGFTGGTGALGAVQDIQSWTFASCTPPQISGASATPSVIWPPNHRWVPVRVNYIVTDPCDLNPNCTLSVSSNEPVNAPGSGNTAPDWQVVDAHRVLLRAERSGSGTGRTYTITITCTDSFGNMSSQNVTVTVPHDRRKR